MSTLITFAFSLVCVFGQRPSCQDVAWILTGRMALEPDYPSALGAAVAAEASKDNVAITETRRSRVIVCLTSP